MSDHMRKMLDELMGTQRDGLQDTNSVRFDGPSVCKSFLMGLCPYDLFHNTVSKGTFKSSKKLDLGTCSKIHDLALKADYELEAKNHDYGYDIDQLEQIRQFVSDCDRKVAVNKRRLEVTQDSESLGPEALAVHELNEQIGVKLAEAEQLGADGNVEESMAMMNLVEELKQNKRKAEDIYRNTVPATTNQQQKLRVCEICAAFLSLYDNDRRLADHFGGRLHMGFIQVRERLTELENIVKKKRSARDSERERRTERRSRERSRSRSRERERRGDRNRDRDRDRERRHKSRSRSRDRERRHRRSRSSDRRRSRERRRSRKDDSRERNRLSQHGRVPRDSDTVEDGELVDTPANQSEPAKDSRDRNGPETNSNEGTENEL